MIYGIGTDIVNMTRLEKNETFLNRFIRRSMTVMEQQAMESRGLVDDKARIAYVAKRFAAKEAVVKALGSGFRDGIYLSDIEILNDEMGRPLVHLHENAAQYLKKCIAAQNVHIHLSLSDDYPYAQAVVVIEG